MISVSEASARILQRIGPLPAVPVTTADAAGRVLAERIVAAFTSPPWDNSSMDGYAICGGGAATRFRVIESVAAGEFPSRALEPGEAMRIMTGAPVPQGADSVIRKEDTDEGLDFVSVHNMRDAGRNIREAGEDFRAGDTLFEAGEALRIPHLGVLASAGVQSVRAHRKPRVAVISSGNELVDLRDFSPRDAGRRIVSSNSISLMAAVRDAGGDCVDLGIARDDPASLRAKVEAARHFDLIVTSAGISVGDHDHVRNVFAELGGQLDFWKVRMRPGAPLAFGTLGDTPWIGLSGNPVSAIVTFEVFVRPAIRRMLGFRDIFPATIPVRLAQKITLAAPLMHFLRAIVSRTAAGDWVAELAGSQSSAVLTALARANALLILPGNRLDHAAGEVHRALPIESRSETAERLVLE